MQQEPFKTISADIAAIQRIPIIPVLLEVICRTTGMGFAAVARVTDEKWIVCAVKDEISFGLKPGGELQLETTICHEIRQSGIEVVIDEVATDPDFCTHHTPRMYGFQSYISIPILRKNGEFFGTLCSIDPRPAKLKNPTIIGMFRLFSELISFHLQSMDDLDSTQSKLSEELVTAEFREQFIAVLSHDLRNPLSAISNSVQLLLGLSPEEEIQQLAGIIKKSAARMSGLIEDTMDLARGRLGGGITLSRNCDKSVQEVLYQVIAEQGAISPQMKIKTGLDLPEIVSFDASRLAQLFSNLLANAFKYGDPRAPVKIIAKSGGGLFHLSVCNACDKIPVAILDRIFQPFSRGEVHPGQQGLGLGLYIASEIARAHGGRLEVESGEEETCFTLTMPTM